jgi:hypothetical protein
MPNTIWGKQTEANINLPSRLPSFPAVPSGAGWRFGRADDIPDLW